MVKFENCKPGMVVQCKQTGRIGEILATRSRAYLRDSIKPIDKDVVVTFIQAPDFLTPRVLLDPDGLRSCHKHFVTGVSYKDMHGRIWEFTGEFLVSPSREKSQVARNPGKSVPVKLEELPITGLGAPEEAGYTPVWEHK